LKFGEILKLVTSLVICQLAGLIGSLFTRPAIPTWYQSLNKPSFAPPNWLFGPVWITLYLLMGIALFLIWRKAGEVQVKTALFIFSLQLLFMPSGLLLFLVFAPQLLA